MANTFHLEDPGFLRLQVLTNAGALQPKLKKAGLPRFEFVGGEQVP